MLLIAITILAYAQDVKMPILEISLAPDTRFYRDMPYTNGTMKLADTEGKWWRCRQSSKHVELQPRII